MLLNKNLLTEASIVLIIILFLEVFSLTLIPEDSRILAAAVFGIGLLLMLFSFLHILFKKGYRMGFLDKLILLFVLSLFLSALMARVYWEQQLVSSFLSYRLFYIYLLYFVFVFLEVSPKRAELMLSVLFLLSVLVFIIDYVTFPDPLFAYRSEERREGITIFFFGQGFTFLGGFYFLNRFFNERRIVHFLLFLLACACLFLLTQSRMNLLALVLGFLLVFLTSRMRNKLMILCLTGIACVSFYYSSDIFKGIREESKLQSQFYKEDVRVKAQDYFLTDLQGGIPTMIFGNGYPSAGSKLDKATLLGMERGFFTADVGLTGIYSFFGILGAFLWIALFYKVFTIKSHSNTWYLKAYFLAILTTIFTGYSLFDPGYMPATILALYLVRCQTSDFPEESHHNTKDIPDSAVRWKAESFPS